MLDLLIVILCLCINAFFSAYEMAFVTVTKEDLQVIEEKRTSLFRRIKRYKQRPERILSVIQIGITLVGAVAAAVGGTGAVESLEPIIVERWQISTTLAEAISILIVIVPLTYFTVVFGELVPKTIAIRHPLFVLIAGSKALFIIDKILSPIVTFLEVSTNFLLKLFKIDTQPEVEPGSVVVDIGPLPIYHQTFVQNLVSMKGLKVKKVLRPWSQVHYLNFSDTEEEVRSKISQTPHSRFPVLDGETMVGLLHTKEFYESRSAEVPWEGIIRPMIEVKEDEKVLEVFLRMQRQRQHLAFVTNKEEMIIGIISIEDIIEEILGDIYEDIDTKRIERLLAYRRLKK